MIELLVLLWLFVLYLLPTIIGAARHAPDVGAVAVVNVLLGWTVLGWIVALALACRTRREPPGWYSNEHATWWQS